MVYGDAMAQQDIIITAPARFPKGECWVWPASRACGGYGTLMYRGRRMSAHRASHIEHKGPIPPGHVVRHVCDNPPCFNPDHLDSGTQSDNLFDAVRRGRKGGMKSPSKLTDDQVRTIYLSAEPASVMAGRYGVARQTIGKIKRGEQWLTVIGDLVQARGVYEHCGAKRGSQKPDAKLTESDVAAIFVSKKLGRDLAVEYGVTKSTISTIIRRRAWRHVTDGMVRP